jgi:glycerate 2-kinase
MIELLRNVIDDSLKEIEAGSLLHQALQREDLSGNFHLLALGKAACSMAKAAQEFFGDRILTALIITAYDPKVLPDNYEVILACHPYPDENSLVAGKKISALLSNLNRGDKLLLLISGGASSLAELPRDNVTLPEIADITKKLQLRGADIIELNTVRKHLSKLKGGQLARAAEPAQVFCFLLSDVIGDRLDTIGSGYAAPDNTTGASALCILQQYSIHISNNIKNALQEETPAMLRNAINRIIGNNELLCHITAQKIMQRGYIPWLLTTEMNGEAIHYAKMIPDIVKSARSAKSRIALPCIAICGGETTVTVRGNGKGGRNQELALAAAINIRNLDGVTVAAIASDGIDGNTKFAGAIVDTNSYDRMLSCGINPEAFLHNNDSSTALGKIDAVIQTGNTNTNLNDLLLILIEKPIP